MAKQIFVYFILATTLLGGCNAAAQQQQKPPAPQKQPTIRRNREGVHSSLQSDIEAIRKTALKSDGTSKIKHIVVAMLENRAFDHMLGWIGQWGVPVDGLTGNEYNIIEKKDGSSVMANVSCDCPYINPFDPLHNIYNVTNELMNGQKWINPAPMSGFAQTHYKHGFSDPGNVMTGFSPDRVPAISTLAKEFAVFDKYFSSIPGPTFPNRLYFHSGTSHGMTQTSNLTILIPGAPQTSVYDIIQANNMTWRTYFEDFPDVLCLRNQRTWDDISERVRWFEHFAKDCQKGDMADYTWISPRFYADFGKQARDQHPDHDVALGEEFIKEVYETIRNSPIWEDTLLIVTYDEHGGFFDHVSPPADGVPNPDGIIGGQGTVNVFNFTRIGVRVPFIAISPYIKKGQVVSEPKNAPAGAQFEHASMYATLKRMYGFPQELTARTAWAAPYDFLFDELDTPRTDCPTTIPTPTVPPTTRAERVIAEAAQPVNDLQLELWQILTSTIRDVELGENERGVSDPSVANANLLRHSPRIASTKEKFSKILLSHSSVRSLRGPRFGGLLNAVNQQTTSTSPFLHERMLKARFSSQGEMSAVVQQIMEALVPK